MTRDERIDCHCSASLKRDIQEVANARDESVSEFVRETVKTRVHELKKEDVVRDAKAEERIEAIIAQGKDEIAQEVAKFRETATAIQSLTARAGVYSVANYEMIKQDHSQTMQNDARATGSRRLRKDIIEDLDLDIDPEEIQEINDNENSTNKPWENDE